MRPNAATTTGSNSIRSGRSTSSPTAPSDGPPQPAGPTPPNPPATRSKRWRSPTGQCQKPTLQPDRYRGAVATQVIVLNGGPRRSLSTGASSTTCRWTRRTPRPWNAPRRSPPACDKPPAAMSSTGPRRPTSYGSDQPCRPVPAPAARLGQHRGQAPFRRNPGAGHRRAEASYLLAVHDQRGRKPSCQRRRRAVGRRLLLVRDRPGQPQGPEPRPRSALRHEPRDRAIRPGGRGRGHPGHRPAAPTWPALGRGRLAAGSTTAAWRSPPSSARPRPRRPGTSTASPRKRPRRWPPSSPAERRAGGSSLQVPT